MKLKPSPFAPAAFPTLPAVKGVLAATASRGFYARRGVERDDVFLFVLPDGTSTAGVFTRSHTASADVDWCRVALKAGKGKARALVVNAGNSNAFTGKAGVLKNDATLKAMVETLGVPREECFLAATGVIGEPLPDPNYMGQMLPDLSGRLAPPDWEACTRAFMTTDTFPKASGGSCEIDGVEVSVAGILKGSGMIMPNMATMLCYVFTDAALTPEVLDTLLRGSVDRSLNSVTVDGDTSTSDSCMLFATGGSGAPLIESADDPRLEAFRALIDETFRDLAHQLVKDGEGASKFVEIRIEGAVSEASAKTIGMHIANSPLIKTAMAAGDANWGRIVMAVGKSLEPISKDEMRIWFGDHLVAEGGMRSPGYDEARASAHFAGDHISVRVDVAAGDAAWTVWTCDLTHAYVDINGAYRT
ncbi:bifunctional glutamate N-acetyltransferase/amino-acid acetyltransferase ArgJ [Henriciella mobilis]|uniref:bifunctional glutamate N-acetyltransferase/amino-acid acetyltransferase ArgJ n=1 Tax=Henriciella mobilis TaxID=2305467 RepID=UPI000E6762B8|nr:bifunctional glutamate N-acetyltransferase/amino-acid acetyltransferase ArgJ [Henriciella mobilis]RIJ17982.1 bifunctional glutamate N-acetyltransferase/amino-acid acetyltransferase ArgJ [Henriciella mobilis]RIJ25210.1 bifunctional glutamate N-acetyltransferase/amino-acid acetyltransferase ArgJ [Henriciella mobilis]